MASFVFSLDDNTLIEQCIKKGHASWKDECLKDLKRKIKDHLKGRQDHLCCYCFRNIFEDHNLVIDIEHILPKHKYVGFMFNMNNLAASCKRCNLKMKGRSVAFIKPCFNVDENPFASENYSFIHPNADVFEEHIKYIVNQEGRNILVSYSVINESEKGYYSMDFFKLSRLERNMNDKAQGIDIEDEDAYEGNPDDDDIDDSDVIAGKKIMDIEGRIEDLASKHQQL
jgi:uncharacterized protein (TIGR02646 family)